MQPQALPAQPQGQAMSNGTARSIVLAKAVPMIQPLISQTLFPASQPLFNYQPRAVGILKRFVIEVVATISNTGSTTITATDFFLTNLLKNVQFTDLNNYVRINTSGQHLAALQSAKRRSNYGATSDWNQQTGNNTSQMLNVAPAAWGVFQGPLTIATGTSATVRGVFEVPIAYSNDDLRGAIYSNVTNTQQNLQIVVNPNAVVLSTTDDTDAVYSGPAGSAGSITQATLSITQEYLDQIPRDQNGQLILPQADLATVYLLNNTTFGGITPNADYFMPYTNFRSFLSTFLIYNNSGIASGRVNGTDLDYIELQAANFSFPYKVNPLLNTQMSRDHVHFDWPKGMYYYPTRNHPIQTQQYGNMQLTIRPSTAGAGAYARVLWEQFAPLNTLVNAASLAS